MKEEWKDVAGYEGLYQVSDHGRVRRVADGKNTWPGRILRLCENVYGYLQIELRRDGRPKNMKVHRLVLEAHVGLAPSPAHEGNHKNGDKTDNRVENLEWVTPAENTQHAYDILGHKAARGENHGRSILTRRDVKKVRNLYAKGQHTQDEIAEIFGVASSTVGRIVRGECWTHVEGPTGHVDNQARGEANGNSRLTEDDVRRIRALYATGQYTYAEIGELFGVALQTVWSIVHYKTWKHVP